MGFAKNTTVDRHDVVDGQYSRQTLSAAGSTDKIDKVLACVQGLPGRGMSS
jgi:hypothetical protein